MASGREVYIKQNAVSNAVIKGLIHPTLGSKIRDNRGTIRYVGPGTPEEPMPYKVGEKVKFDQFAGIQVTVGDEELLMVADTDVFCSFSE